MVFVYIDVEIFRFSFLCISFIYSVLGAVLLIAILGH